MALISIKSLAEAARNRGFRGHGSDGYVQLYAPEHTGPDSVWSFDSQYSTCDVVLSDSPKVGYGYNGYFHGPWHPGLVQSDCPGVQRLLAHPAMQGFEVAA